MLQSCHVQGRLLVTGHCLAGPHEVARAFRSAMESDTLEPLTALPGAYTCLVVRDGAEWNTDAVGPTKRLLAADPLKRLRDR